MVTEVYKSLFSSLRWNVNQPLQHRKQCIHFSQEYLKKKKHENDKQQQMERIFIGNWIVSWLNQRFPFTCIFHEHGEFPFCSFF